MPFSGPPVARQDRAEGRVNGRASGRDDRFCGDRAEGLELLEGARQGSRMSTAVLSRTRSDGPEEFPCDEKRPSPKERQSLSVMDVETEQLSEPEGCDHCTDFVGYVAEGQVQIDDAHYSPSDCEGMQKDDSCSREDGPEVAAAKEGSKPTQCNALWQPARVVSGPKFFNQSHLLRDTVESSCSAVDYKGDCKGSDGVSDCKSQAKESVLVSSWNVAGCGARQVKLMLSHVVASDIVSIQEFPKQPPGWKVLLGENFCGVLRQNYFMYRSVGVFYRKSKFQLIKKIGVSRGIWVKLKHLSTGAMFVGGVGALAQQ